MNAREMPHTYKLGRPNIGPSGTRVRNSPVGYRVLGLAALKYPTYHVGYKLDAPGRD